MRWWVVTTTTTTTMTDNQHNRVAEKKWPKSSNKYPNIKFYWKEELLHYQKGALLFNTLQNKFNKVFHQRKKYFLKRKRVQKAISVTARKTMLPPTTSLHSTYPIQFNVMAPTVLVFLSHLTKLLWKCRQQLQQRRKDNRTFKK